MTIENLRKLIKDDETEIVEYKVNWFNKEELGMYISALSNSAAYYREEHAYFIWGITDDVPHEIVGTDFKFDKDYGGEPLKHYLARNLTPSIAFEFEELLVDGKRIVVLTIPAAKEVITEFNKERYIRIGSSKELLRKFPERERKLWQILSKDEWNMIGEESVRQDLTFKILRNYFDGNGISYTDDNFLRNNSLLTPSGKFNYLAFMLSDQFNVSIKVAEFNGINKQSDFISRKEFGGCCLIKSIYDVLSYLDIRNEVRSYFDPGNPARRDEFLYDKDSCREAWINACLHNDWSTGLGPSIYFFSDHLEIFSYGSPLRVQSKEDFLNAFSHPINKELNIVFMKIDLSEHSGKGVSTILKKYGSGVFDFESKTSFTVSIPFNTKAMKAETSESGFTEKFTEKFTENEIKIIQIIMRNSSAKTGEIANELGISRRAVQNNLLKLKEKNVLRRVGPDKGGHWEIIDKK